MRRHVVCCLLGFVLCASGSRALADGFRCPSTGRLIDLGDTMGEVELKCGAPAAREEVLEPRCRRTGRFRTIKTGERWLYDFGSTNLTRILTFSGDRLSRVDTGGYGSSR